MDARAINVKVETSQIREVLGEAVNKELRDLRTEAKNLRAEVARLKESLENLADSKRISKKVERAIVGRLADLIRDLETFGYVIVPKTGQV